MSVIFTFYYLEQSFSKALYIGIQYLPIETLKDPYIFDFITLREDMNEQDIENQLVKKITKFLLELGSGFVFIGNQYYLTSRLNPILIEP